MLGQHKLGSIQVVRAIACSAVVISHALSKILREQPDVENIYRFNRDLVTLGHFGVDLFFILSGFLMYYVHSNDFGKIGAAKDFLIKRCIRIVPIYWLLSILALVILVLYPNLFSFRSSAELHWVLGSFFFIPTETSYGIDTPLLGVGWTLNYEMHFYFIFAVVLLCTLRSGIFILAMAISLLVLLGYFLQPEHSWISLIMSPMLLEFLIGVVIGIVLKKPHLSLERYNKLLIVTGTLLIVGSIFDIPKSEFERVISWGIGSALLLVGFILLPINNNNIVVKIIILAGDASYSTYLIQVFSLPAIFLVLKILGLLNSLNISILMFIMVIGTWIIGMSLYIIIERPIYKYLKSTLLPKIRK